MILLIKLLFAHFIGDFLLQPKSWVEIKERKKARSFVLYLHTLIHGALVLLVCWDLNNWFVAVLIMLAHGTIDFIKLYAQKESNKPKWFIIDQLSHIISIVVIWFVWFNPTIKLDIWFDLPMVWVYATAILFLTTVSGIIIQVIMSNWSESLKESNDASLKNAGKYIGILERLFVFTFVVSGNWQAIGFLLAAKSVFRFGDLRESKDRKLTEYILIGSLLSFAIAVATALLVLELAKVF